MKAVAAVVFGMAALLVASSPSRAQGIAPFDLIWDAIDVNGLPVAPSWGYQLIRAPADPPLPDPGRLCNNFSGHSTGNPPCVKQPIWWEPAGIFCDGHVNWRTVSYAGPLYWDVIDGHSSLLLSDDYNFWLAPPGPTTLTTASPQVLQLAFNSDETIDHFHTPWWEAFRGAVADGRGTVVNTDYAVVIGLLGLHCEHSCVTEIHPVYAMAIHDPIRRSPNDDVWAIFVRNWGDQGFCASGMNTVSLTSITLRLPWRRGATSIDLGPASIFKFGPDSLDGTSAGRQVSGPVIGADPGNSLSATFTLPSATGSSVPPGVRINGELHLQWSGPELGDPCASIRSQLMALQDELARLYAGFPANKASIPGVVTAAERRLEEWHRQHDRQLAHLEQGLAVCDRSRSLASVEALRITEPEERTPELRIQELLDKLPPARRSEALARSSELKSVSEDRAILMHGPKKIGVPPATVIMIAPQPVRDTVAPNPEKTAKDRRRAEILCAAFDNRIPGFPNVCR